MRKFKFTKLRMIWAIIRGRTVVYNAEITSEGIRVRNKKSCIVDSTFLKVGVKNHLGKNLVGGN